MLDACRAAAFSPEIKGAGGSDTEEARALAYADMVASQVMSGGALDTAERVTPPERFVDARFTLAYAGAFDAYRRGDTVTLRGTAALLRVLQRQAAAKSEHMEMGMNMNPNNPQRMAIVVQQVDALQAAAAGRREEAVTALRNAAAAELAIPYDFGPPYIEKPTLELLAEMLLAMKRKGEAAEAYRAALARAPGRRVATEGLRTATADSVP